jgi:hypothetical protein
MIVNVPEAQTGSAAVPIHLADDIAGSIFHQSEQGMTEDYASDVKKYVV